MILVDQDLDPHPAPGSAAHSRFTAHSALDKLPSQRALAQFLRIARAEVRLSGQVSVLLTTDEAIRELNRRFRGIDKPTDVLSFPAPESASNIAGDIAIGVHTAMRQAADQRHALSNEIKILILHGLLHLAGYDHESDNGRMARRERQLRAKLGLPQGLIERSTGDGRPVRKSRSGGDGPRGQRESALNADRCQGTTSVVPKKPLKFFSNGGLQPARESSEGDGLQPVRERKKNRAALAPEGAVLSRPENASGAKAPSTGGGQSYGLKPVPFTGQPAPSAKQKSESFARLKSAKPRSRP